MDLSFDHFVAVLPFVFVVATAFFASVIGGVAGYGTGLLLPPVLVPVIGAEAVVPVIGLSTLLTNGSRLWAFFNALDWHKARLLTLTALPTTIGGAYGYTLLTGTHVAMLIGIMLIVLVPVRYWLKKRRFALSTRGVGAAGVGYGLLAGGTAGSGVVLISILMSAGLGGQAVIATDAAISMLLGVVKSATFFTRGALPWPMITMALLIGISAVPGAFVAKRIAVRFSGDAHIRILDGAVILGGILLVWRGVTG